MDRHLKLALLAIASPPTGKGEWLAVAIGSRHGLDGKEEWLASLLSADATEQLLKGDSAGSGDVLDTIFDQTWSTSAGQWFNEGNVGTDDGAGRKTSPRRHESGTALWIDGIERIHVFSRGADGKSNADEVGAPLVALDCAGTVIYADSSEKPPATWARSRLNLVIADELWPASTDPDQWAGRTTPVKLTSFDLVLHIPMPAGAHDGNNQVRFDTRLLLFASANKNQGSLWFDKPQAKIEPKRLSAQFMSLKLAITNASGYKRSRTVKHFHAMASLKAGFVTDSSSFSAPVPLLAALDVFASKAPSMEVKTRKAGFRPSADGKHLWLRSEVGWSTSSWEDLWRGTYGAVSGDNRETDDIFNDSEQLFWIGYEQTIEPHQLYGVGMGADWSVLFRFDEAKPPRSRRLIEFILELFDPYEGIANYQALRRFRPETGASAALDLKVATGSVDQPWQTVGFYTPPRARRLLWKAPDWAKLAKTLGTLKLETFQPADGCHWWDASAWQHAIKLGKMRLCTIAGQPLALTKNNARLTSYGGPSNKNSGLQPQRPKRLVAPQTGTFFSVADLKIDGNPAHIVIGSLEFALSKSKGLTYDVGRIVHARPVGYPPEIRFEVAMILKAVGVSPVAEDPLPASAGSTAFAESARDTAPLLLPTTAPEPIDLSLSAVETWGEQVDQKLEWTLDVDLDAAAALSKGSVYNPGSLIVLDPRPLRVAAVEGVHVEADDTGASIASYQAGDDGQYSWRFRNQAQKSRIALPPQIIGEAMEKRVAVAGLLDDITPGKSVEARFGSLTRVEVDATYRDTRTQEPGWNLRRILNRVSDGPPGALLRDLRLEIAYGLIVQHTPRSETWLAEIAGIIGLPPQPGEGATSTGSAARLVRRRAALLRLQASRIAIDKVWAGRPEARFETSEDLIFTLRTHEESLGSGRGTETAFLYPLARPMAESWPATIDAPPGGAGDPLTTTFAETANAFPGGVPWAFESANILDEVYRSPVTKEGRISDLFLSALGGWGQQRAAFAGGKSIIETETNQGRMSYYKLERLGRIGGLYNRAKHVIIYRRTVAPSAQFYNDRWQTQDEHVGRPILRKVEEFVEILEPERAYPENGTALMEAGCLAGSRFVTRKMLVDSSWGGDVRREGWIVPLWRKNLAPKVDPGKPLDDDSVAALFPKPHVQLLMFGEDGKPTAVEIDTPEKLVFYSSSISFETADRMDSWHAVEGIDYCDAPPPVVLETKPPQSGDLHDAMLGPVPRGAGGHDPLTFELVDARVPIQIAARRIEDGPAIVAKNITLSRARPLVAPASSRDKGDMARSAGIGSAQIEADIRGRLDRLFARVPAAFADVAREMASGRDAALAAINRSEAGLIAELAKIRDDAGKAAGALPPVVDWSKAAEKVVYDAIAQIQGERKRINGQVRSALEQGRLEFTDQILRQKTDWAARLTDLAKTLETLAPDSVIDKPQATLKAAVKGFEADVLGWKNEAQTDIGRGFSQISANLDAVTRALNFVAPVASLKQAADDRFAAIDAQLDDFGDQSAEWEFTTDAKVKAAQAQATILIDGIRQQIRPARQQIEKLSLTARIPAALKRGADKAIVLIDQLGQPLTDLQIAINAIVAAADDTLIKANLKISFDALKKTIGDVQSEVDGAFDAAVFDASELEASLKARVATLSDAAATWRTDIGGLVDTLGEKSIEALGIVATKADALLKAAAGSLVTPQVRQAAADGAGVIRDKVLPALDQLPGQAEHALDALDAKVRDDDEAWRLMIERASAAALAFVQTFTPVLGAAANVEARIREHVEGLADAGQAGVDAVTQQIHRFADEARAAVNEIADDLNAIRGRLEEMAAAAARQIGDRVGSALGEMQSELARVIGRSPDELLRDGQTLYQDGDNLMRAIRLVGEGPTTNGLSLNRPETAFALDALKPLVDMTPAVALANRVAGQVAAVGNAAEAAGKLFEALGLRLPVNAIGADLIPDSLKGLSLSKMFPDFAGMDLEGLLTKAGFPDMSGKDSQGVKITRGFDKDRREAWLKANIDVTLDKPAALVEFGPVAIMLDQGQFHAETRVAVDASGKVEKDAKGMIAGDWRVMAGGMEVVTFEKTPLVFDKTGKVDFQIAQDRVRLAPTLEFLTNLMSKFKQSVPTGVEIISRGGVPAGIVAKIAIDVPPVATGAFSITDLNIAASFGIIAQPRFEIIGTLDIGSRDAPFTIAVWILNGGGYITQSLSYQPTARPQPILVYTLDVSIVAGVGLAFGFGVVSGGVWLQVGCSVALTWTTGPGGNVTTVTAFLLARGNVDIAGLVTASIMLRLEISYDGAEMRARGTLRLSFRISCFYTLKVAQGVEYKILGERRAAPDATNYAASFQ